MSKLISMDKKYKTRDGRDVRLLCTDNLGVCAGSYPVVAIVEGAASVFTATGGFYTESVEHGLDLIEVVQEHELWVEIFSHDAFIDAIGHRTKEGLQESINDSCNMSSKRYKLLATKKITYVEGETCL